MVVCPFCSASGAVELESASVQDLDRLYQRLYKAPVARLFGEHRSLSLMSCTACDLRWYEPMIGGDEDFYNTLQHKSWYYVEHKHEFDLALPYIEPSDRVLEVGSGKGNFARFVQQARGKEGIRYTGLDFSQEAQRMAAANGIDIRVQSVQEFSRANPESQDIVCAFQVLEHVVDIRSFVDAMTTAVRPGGLLLIAVPSEDSYIASSNNLALNLPPHHISRYPDRWFHCAAQILNLELVALEHDPLQPHHRYDYIYQLTIEACYRCLAWTGLRRKPVDHSWLNWLFRIPATLLGHFLSRGLNARNSPYGHTVFAVFRKPLQATHEPTVSDSLAQRPTD